MKPYQICKRCVMDTSDAKITFDEYGVCEYCRNFDVNIRPHWHTDERGLRELEPAIDSMKRYGKSREYDCVIGLSGGVDSSYLVHTAVKRFGLRPLCMHVDAGWNSQQAVNNIEKITDGLGLELHTEVINWPEMRDLQLAFFKAGVPHLDTPQDHAFFAGLYNYAVKHGVRDVLTGANYSTESVREPLEWHYHASDLTQLRDIHLRFGTIPLKTFPLCDVVKNRLYYRFWKGMRIIKPLNHIPYIKEAAMQELVETYGWQKYAHKHYESRFTRFFEGYWQPTRFGYDKRRAHFSSEILSEQMTRDDALTKLAQPAYDPETLQHDFEYIATKLGISIDELKSLHAAPKKTFRDYRNSMTLIEPATAFLRAVGIQRAVMR
jgi:N-acetyl sugar amidotransferase